MVSRETQYHTTLEFYKLDIKRPQLCGFCHIILFTSVKNPPHRFVRLSTIFLFFVYILYADYLYLCFFLSKIV